MKALLIDVGSTFIKYSVYDKEKGIVFFNKTSFPQPVQKDEVRFIVSRKEICHKILQIFEEVKQCGYNVSVAFFSVQMHGYVVKYKDDTFSEYVSWRDKSGNKAHKKFEGMNFNDFGLTIANNLPVTKINSDFVQEFYTLGSYLVYSLTGCNTTHITDAFASGFYYSPLGNVNQFAKGMVMPSVCHELTVVGEFNRIKIVCAFGDHQVSVLGSGVNEQSYLINIGTGAQVCCVAPYGQSDGLYQKRPYFDKQSCLYSFCGLHGIDGNTRIKDEFVKRVLECIKLLPKKQSVFVGGGGGEETFSLLKETFNKIGISCTKLDFDIGTRGLTLLAKKYFLKN